MSSRGSVATDGSALLGGTLHEWLAPRSLANDSFFAAEADRIAELCSRMANRFASGGRLIALGASPAACSDVRHVSVEFVHPVIVGKRALPALGLTGRGADLATQMTMLGAPQDIVIAFGACGDDTSDHVSRALALSRARGCLTVAFDTLGAEVEFRPVCDDVFVWQELVETLYHVLWELVHVFFEHGSDRGGARVSDIGSSAFLYPFLVGQTYDRAAVTRDVAGSVRTKAAEIRALRERTLLADDGASLLAAVQALRERLDAGGAVLAFGNGGSATDAMDLVADFRAPPPATQLTPCRALDLTEDSAILTALANDVGPDVQFARQIIAYGTDRDVAIGFSTSGSSRNVCAAFVEARRRGLATIAFTGYDGGRIAAEGLADHVIVVPSQYVPRIQEAHATAYHFLRSVNLLPKTETFGSRPRTD